VVSPSSKRRAVKLVIETGIGTTAEACRALGLARSSYYRNSALSTESCDFQKQIVSLSQDHPRYGYRRVTALLRRAGHEINAKWILVGFWCRQNICLDLKWFRRI
jgi:putative transposase